MNRFIKTTILSAAVAATTLATLPAANAGDGWRRHHNRHQSVRRSSDSDLLAAGIVGLALGALVVGAAAANEPDYYEPEPVYRNPRPRPRPDRNYYVEPDVVYVDDDYAGAMEPWSPEWYRYCDNRYRSFNARTGTFTGYDGLKHFCVAD